VLFSYVVFLVSRGEAWAAIIIVPFVLAGLAMSLWLIVSGVKGLMSASRRKGHTAMSYADVRRELKTTDQQPFVTDRRGARSS
jgi:hypothetical protein